MLKFITNIIISFCSIMCTIITFFQFFLGFETFNEVIEKMSFVNSKEFKIIFACIILIVVFLFHWTRYKKKARNKIDVGEYVHIFHHKVRNEIFKMRKKNEQEPTLSHEDYYDYIKKTCYELCEQISNFLSDKTKKSFSICIKMLDVESLKRDEVEETKVYTLCRYGKDSNDRSQKESDKRHKLGSSNMLSVKNNSDFKLILSDKDEHKGINAFVCSNLVMWHIISQILKKEKYENSTDKYWKDYRSTIVVPIRIDSEFLPSDFEKFRADSYQTVAFLCVDYAKPMSKALINELFGYVKGFGDAFYELFYEITLYDRKIKKREEICSK